MIAKLKETNLCWERVPKHLKGFVEWQATRAKHYTNDVKTAKSRNYTTVVGLRAYW